MRRRPLVTVAAAVVVLLAATSDWSAVRSEALFTAGHASTANVLGTRSWFYYLHHRPSPAVADTQSSVVDLTMNTSAPTGTTLYHLSTDISGTDAGRVIQRSTGLTSDTNTKHYEDWWGPVLASGHRYTRATLRIWAQPRTNGGGATMEVTLRDRTGATASVTDVTSATYARSDWSTGGSFSVVQLDLQFDWLLAAGHRFELRIMALNAAKGDQDVIVAYDTSSYGSTFTLP